MARISDEDVQRGLVWARNYGEIESYKQIAPRGRKWLIRTSVQTTPSGQQLGWTEQHAIPTELVFTSREALAFVYGLAIAGTRHGGRQAHAAHEWNW
jgi:hypothetical protein